MGRGYLFGWFALPSLRALKDVANYVGDLQPLAKAALREEYANSKNYGDGHIYRYMRNCVRRKDDPGARKWLARLSESKRKDIKKLEKMAAKFPAMQDFQMALDRLLPFIGLWDALQIGTFHRLLTLRCPEVCYLHDFCGMI